MSFLMMLLAALSFAFSPAFYVHAPKRQYDDQRTNDGCEVDGGYCNMK